MSYISKFDLTRDCPELLKTARKAPMLERDEEFALATAWRKKRDPVALNKLVNSHLRLVISIAGKYRHYGLPLPDLVQEGTIGLMEAANRFETEKGVRFSTYASWWIRSSIQDHVLRNWSIVRTGTTAAQKSLFFNMKRLRTRIEGELDGPLSEQARDRIAAELRVRKVDVDRMEGRLFSPDHSLNARFGEGENAEWQDLLSCDRARPDEIVAQARDSHAQRRLLAEAMACLTGREIEIIRGRCMEDKALTLAQLGDQLGISKERVRQLEGQALKKMRKALIELTGDSQVAGLANFG